jgi:hypothetical protein
MATLKPELKAILDRYGINPRDTSQIWDCRGTLVLYHKAYETIAAKESIRFDAPQIIRGEKDEAVVMVTGRMGERVEWSFGEAVIGQNYQVSGKQAAYPYAMAEKRAKDRVIAKLVGLAAYVYSEDEADEFKHDRRGHDTRHDNDAVDDLPPLKPAPLNVPVPMDAEGSRSDWRLWATREMPTRLKACRTADEVDDVIRANSDSLDNLKKVSAPAYTAIIKLQTQLIEQLLTAKAA